jgi:hypothetical protein
MKMPNEGFLTDEDVRRLTGFTRASGQEAWLKKEGVPFKCRGPVVLVLWTHVERWIEGAPTPTGPGINWAALEVSNAKTITYKERIARKNRERGI